MKENPNRCAFLKSLTKWPYVKRCEGKPVPGSAMCEEHKDSEE